MATTKVRTRESEPADKVEILARVALGQPSFATPAVSGGVMYLRTRSQLFSLGGKRSAMADSATDAQLK